MFEARPTLEDFKGQLERLFGQALSPQAEEAARDFWDCWDSFQLEIARRGLSVHVDALHLGTIFPEYKRYHAWKGAGSVLIIIGALVVWFLWPVGLALLLGGVAAHAIGNWRRFNDAKQFAESLMKKATLQDRDGGFAGLCSNYIAGTIQFATTKGTAHWPQHASNALTGMHTRVST
jgi:hypothetical protein